jgi:hypothetical protein
LLIQGEREENVGQNSKTDDYEAATLDLIAYLTRPVSAKALLYANHFEIERMVVYISRV